MLISVVIPLYNKAPWVNRTLTSVAEQTHPDFECLVVNDGSTDGGEALVAEFARNDPRFRLITQANAGVSVARNTGWQAAKSEWIAFLDADDTWHPDFLKEIALAAAGNAPHIGIIATGFHCNRTQKTHSMAVESGIIDNYFEDRVRQRNHILSCSSVAIYKQALKKVNGFPPGMAIYEDVYCWIRIALRYDILFIGKVLSTYHNDDCMSAFKLLKRKPFVENYISFSRLYAIDKKLMSTKPYATAYVQYLIGNISYFFWNNRYYKKSLQLLLNYPHPFSLNGMLFFICFFMKRIKGLSVNAYNIVCKFLNYPKNIISNI